MIPVLNPGGKRRRKFRWTKGRRRAFKKMIAARGGRRHRRKGGRRRHWSSVARRRRHRGYMKGLLCGPKGRGRLRKMRKRMCHVTPSTYKAPEGWLPGLFGSRAANPGRARFHYRGRNPVSGVLGGVKSAFSPSKLMNALPLVGGVLLNNVARNWIGRLGFMPAAVGPGTWGNLGIGVATAGASAFVANKVLPRFAPAILTGGLVEVVMAAAYQALGLSMKGCAGCHGVGCAGCGGVADFMSAASPVRRGLSGGTADGGVVFGPKSPARDESFFGGDESDPLGGDEAEEDLF